MPPKKTVYSGSSASPKIDAATAKKNAKNLKRKAQRARHQAITSEQVEELEDDLMAELAGVGKPATPEGSDSEDDSISVLSEVSVVVDDISQFPLCFLDNVCRVRLENMPADTIRSLFRRILRFIPADYSDEEVIVLGFVATRILSFNHMLRELVIGLLEDHSTFEYVTHEVTPTLRAIARASSEDMPRILARAKPWVGPAMKRAYEWTEDPSLWVSSTRAVEHQVQAMEADYFRFGSGSFIKYFLDSSATSGVVNGRTLSGSTAGFRAEVANLLCGVKLEAHMGAKTVRYETCIFIVLFLISARAHPIRDSSLMYKMARIQQLVDGASQNAPEGSASKARLVACNRWFLKNISNDSLGDAILKSCPADLVIQYEDLQYLKAVGDGEVLFGLFIMSGMPT